MFRVEQIRPNLFNNSFFRAKHINISQNATFRGIRAFKLAEDRTNEQSHGPFSRLNCQKMALSWRPIKTGSHNWKLWAAIMSIKIICHRTDISKAFIKLLLNVCCVRFCSRFWPSNECVWTQSIYEIRSVFSTQCVCAQGTRYRLDRCEWSSFEKRPH